MKQFDLGYRGDDVTWSIPCSCMYWMRSSDEKVGPLSVKIDLRVHTGRSNLEISWSGSGLSWMTLCT